MSSEDRAGRENTAQSPERRQTRASQGHACPRQLAGVKAFCFSWAERCARCAIIRLAPPVEGRPELLATLDALKDEHGLAESNYAALVRELNARVLAVFASARASEGELARERDKRRRTT